jgi:hypothetical protein
MARIVAPQACSEVRCSNEHTSACGLAGCARSLKPHVPRSCTLPASNLLCEPQQRRRAHEAMRKERLERFMAGFNTISLKLKEMYQMITLGGDAELELVDSLDPFSEVLQYHSLSSRLSLLAWSNA